MKATKKIVGATAALVAALALSAGSTFAWFTTQNTAKVNNISATVITQSNLQVALGQTTSDTAPTSGWGSVIDMTGKITGITLDALTLDDTNTKLVTRESADGANTAYISFRIWFRSTEDANLKFDSTTSKVDSTAGNTANDVYAIKELSGYSDGSPISAGTVIQADAKNAVRVSIKASTGNIMVWEPNADQGYRNDVGQHSLASKYEEDLAKSVDPDATTTAYTNKHYTTSDTLTAVTADTVLLNLTANTAAYLDIWMWIEGNDGDCLNSIFNDTINAVLGFSSAA